MWRTLNPTEHLTNSVSVCGWRNPHEHGKQEGPRSFASDHTVMLMLMLLLMTVVMLLLLMMMMIVVMLAA